MQINKKNIKVISIILILLSCLCFSILGGIIKYTSSSLHAFEQAFFRNIFSIFLLLPFVIQQKINPLRTEKKKFFFIRSFFGGLTMLLLFWSYTLIPLSQAMAISFSTPLFIFLGSIIIFKERPSHLNIFALVIGFLFTIVIIRPDLNIQHGTIIATFAAITHAISGLMVKFLTRTESVISIMFFMVLLMTPITFLPALTVWESPDNISLWFSLILLAVFGTLGNYFWTKSISLSPMTLIMPFDFSKLIFATIIGSIFFNETISYTTLICGGGLIICNLLILKK